MSAFEEAADHVLEGSDDLNVVVGPMVWKPDDSRDGKSWYFVVATSEEGRGFRCDQFVIGEDPEREAFRSRFIYALTSRGPLVVHVMDDELQMARLCEAIWPGERIAELRKQVETERRTDAA